MHGERGRRGVRPLLLEQAGFEKSRRCVPVTTRPPADFDVIVIGAGMVGLNAAIKLEEAGFAYTVFEAAEGIGGTWWRNTYPGAAVDTPSHYYSYSFELNPNWTKYYPPGPEYLEYMRGVAEKYDLYRNIRLSTSVLSADWNEDDQRWTVVTRSADGTVERHRARAVVTALGMLNAPNIPDVEGLATFEGEIVHTAEWDPQLDLTGKRVVILGTGCTAVQVVANIVDQVESLDAVVRSPHWIVPEKAVVNDVTEGERWAMRHLPTTGMVPAQGLLAGIRQSVPDAAHRPGMGGHASVRVAVERPRPADCARAPAKLLPGSTGSHRQAHPGLPPYAKRIVKDPDSRRTQSRACGPAPGLVRTCPPQRCHHHGGGVHRGGRHHLRKTGFKLQFASYIDITGRGGHKLADVWDDGDDPRAYWVSRCRGFRICSSRPAPTVHRIMVPGTHPQ